VLSVNTPVAVPRPATSDTVNFSQLTKVQANDL
jgi:hypothetical protein